MRATSQILTSSPSIGPDIRTKLFYLSFFSSVLLLVLARRQRVCGLVHNVAYAHSCLLHKAICFLNCLQRTFQANFLLVCISPGICFIENF
jgi:hypothetical protein